MSLPAFPDRNTLFFFEFVYVLVFFGIIIAVKTAVSSCRLSGAVFFVHFVRLSGVDDVPSCQIFDMNECLRMYS